MKKTLDIEKHHRHQTRFFAKEFSNKSEYSVSEWQKSYLEKIERDVLGKKYKGKKLIDLGSGSGYVAIEMARKGLEVIACDLTKESLKKIERVKKRYGLSRLKVLNRPAEDLPLDPGSVDYLVANAILEHIPDEKRAISEWKRILKPGGRCMIAVPIKFRYIWPFLWPLNFIHDRRLGHLRRYDLKTLKKKFKMNVHKVYYTGHLVKVIGVLPSFIFGVNSIDPLLERIDKRLECRRYGANNIIVVFEKAKVKKVKKKK